MCPSYSSSELIMSTHSASARFLLVFTPGDEGAVMQHAVLQLDTHLWVRGHQLTVVTPVQSGDFVHQGSSAVEGQPITFEDNLTLRRQQRQGVQLQRTI